MNQTNSKKCTICAALCSIAFIIASFILSGFYRKDLFQMGVNFIYNYQKNGNQFTLVIYNIFSLFGHIPFVGPILGILYLCVYRKLNAFVYLIYFGFNVYLIAITKQGFQDQRPFWYNAKIQQFDWVGCSTQYGFPSGHSWISVLMYEPILTDFIGLGSYRWGSIFLFMFGILIPMSRMYLGLHSADQIIVGLTLSFCFLVLYRFLLQKWLFWYAYECAFGKKYKISFRLTTIFLNVIFLLIPIVLFVVNTTLTPVSKQLINVLNRECSPDPPLTIDALQSKHSRDGALMSGVFGLIYGLFLSSHFGQKNLWIHYYMGFWSYKRISNIFLKLLIYILLLGLTVGIFFALIPHFIHNFYGKYLLASLGLIAGGIVVSFLAPYCAMKWKVVQIQEEELVESPKDDRKKHFSGEEMEMQKNKSEKKEDIKQNLSIN